MSMGMLYGDCNTFLILNKLKVIVSYEVCSSMYSLNLSHVKII